MIFSPNPIQLKITEYVPAGIGLIGASKYVQDKASDHLRGRIGDENATKLKEIDKDIQERSSIALDEAIAEAKAAKEERKNKKQAAEELADSRLMGFDRFAQAELHTGPVQVLLRIMRLEVDAPGKIVLEETEPQVSRMSVNQ